MKKRLLSCMLVLTLILAAFPFSVFATEGLTNFTATREYTEGQFTDVKAGDWYEPNVATAVRLGLLYGSAPDRFNVGGTVTLAETITMAARLHSIYYNGSADFVQGDPWYQVYVDYALENKIISAPYADYKRYATRSEYAVILANALPASALAVINQVDDEAIPDVPLSRSYAEAVYTLYRAGVLTGYAGGYYRPDNYVSRSEIAAIVTRMADPSLRREITLTKGSSSEGGGLTGPQISQACSDAVFYIEIADDNGQFLGSGSGFFIDPSGIAVTNYHVMEGATTATVTLTDGTEHAVTGVCSYSEDNDLAVIKVEGGSFPSLELGSSGDLIAGQTVFAIGSPLGFDNTLSQGIISNANRVIEGFRYIQMTAPISPGSSGGALLDDSGRVIGITCGGYTAEYDAQNINLAIPIDLVKSMSREVVSTVAESFANAGLYYYLYPENYTVNVTKGHSETINVYQSMGTPGRMSFIIENGEVIDCEWGDWEDSWNIPLTITGLAAGESSIHFKLFDESGKIYDEDDVYVYVYDTPIDVNITAAPSSLSTTVGGSATTRITLDKVDGFFLYSTVADPGIVSSVWGEWINDNSLPLMVYGLKSGSTTIRVDVYDKHNLFVKSIYLAVSVK